MLNPFAPRLTSPSIKSIPAAFIAASNAACRRRPGTENAAESASAQGRLSSEESLDHTPEPCRPSTGGRGANRPAGGNWLRNFTPHFFWALGLSRGLGDASRRFPASFISLCHPLA